MIDPSPTLTNVGVRCGSQPSCSQISNDTVFLPSATYGLYSGVSVVPTETLRRSHTELERLAVVAIDQSYGRAKSEKLSHLGSPACRCRVQK